MSGRNEQKFRRDEGEGRGNRYEDGGESLGHGRGMRKSEGDGRGHIEEE